MRQVVRREPAAATATVVLILLLFVGGGVSHPVAGQQAPDADQAGHIHRAEELFASLRGAWSCAGQFANGRAIEADLIFTPVLDGRSVCFTHVDRPPNRYAQHASWSLHVPSNRIVSLALASSAETRVATPSLFVASNWTARSLTLVADTLLGPPWAPNRFTYTLDSIDGADRLRKVWEYERNGQWSVGDHLDCRRADARPTGAAWRDLYLADLEATRELITTSHPGAADEANPAFRAALRSAYAEARVAAHAVDDYASYRLPLERFVSRFGDAHLAVRFRMPLPGLWDSGVRATYQGSHFVIRSIDARYGAEVHALRGARLESCDGVPAMDLFRGGPITGRHRPGVEADFYLLAPWLLVAADSAQRSARCQIVNEAGESVLRLDWARTSEAAIEQSIRGEDAAGAPLSLERQNGMHWVNLGTFQATGADADRMRALLAGLRREIGARRRPELIVLDVRGNEGGSSLWANQVVDTLFGEEWGAAARAWLADGVYTQWRVSPNNLAGLRANMRQVEDAHGAQNSTLGVLRVFASEMERAISAGEPLIGAHRTRAGVPVPEPVALPARIVVLSDAACFSACLDFLDQLRLHPQVIHVGHPTGVDTDYMESWFLDLPSGLGRLHYPMKVYRNRRRANNEGYTPHVHYDGALDDSEAVRAWIRTNHTGWRSFKQNMR